MNRIYKNIIIYLVAASVTVLGIFLPPKLFSISENQICNELGEIKNETPTESTDSSQMQYTADYETYSFTSKIWSELTAIAETQPLEINGAENVETIVTSIERALRPLEPYFNIQADEWKTATIVKFSSRIYKSYTFYDITLLKSSEGGRSDFLKMFYEPTSGAIFDFSCDGGIETLPDSVYNYYVNLLGYGNTAKMSNLLNRLPTSKISVTFDATIGPFKVLGQVTDRHVSFSLSLAYSNFEEYLSDFENATNRER